MRVNEIFYSLQGEGFHTGTPTIFIRLSGCNLRCAFCDTLHEPFEELSEEEIIERIAPYPASLVVVTGGEPALQLTESLVDLLHVQNKYVAVETNGTRPLPANVDWITLSPKQSFVGDKGKVVLSYADEVKVVYDGVHPIEQMVEGLESDNWFVQPCDTGDERRNAELTAQCIDFVKDHPWWRLSIQTHKILGMP